MSKTTPSEVWDHRIRILTDVTRYPTRMDCAAKLGASQRSVSLWTKILRDNGVEIPGRVHSANRTMGELVVKVRELESEIVTLKALRGGM